MVSLCFENRTFQKRNSKHFSSGIGFDDVFSPIEHFSTHPPIPYPTGVCLFSSHPQGPHCLHSHTICLLCCFLSLLTSVSTVSHTLSLTWSLLFSSLSAPAFTLSYIFYVCWPAAIPPLQSISAHHYPKKTRYERCINIVSILDNSIASDLSIYCDCDIPNLFFCIHDYL